MTWSRRQFLTGVGVLAAVSGTAGRVVAKTLNINGVRYGMVHDESLCIGCTACWMLGEGLSRLYGCLSGSEQGAGRRLAPDDYS